MKKNIISGLLCIILSTTFFQYSMDQDRLLKKRRSFHKINELSKCKAVRRLIDLESEESQREERVASSSSTTQSASTSSASTGQAPATSTVGSPHTEVPCATTNDTEKEMALWEALKAGNSKLALDLIAQGASLYLVNETEDQNFISLCFANNLHDLLKKILANDDYYLKLYDLVVALIENAHTKQNNVFYLQELIKLGLNPNKHPKTKKCLLSTAINCCKRYPDNIKITIITQSLIKAGASADIFIQKNSIQKIAIVLQYGIDPTPLLDSAIKNLANANNKSIRIIRLLLESGASIATYVKANDIGLVEFLIKHGADLSHPSNERLLHSAALRNYNRMVDLLLTEVDITKTDTHYKQTAIYAAALYGHIAMVQKLLKAGVPPFKKGSLEEQLLAAVQQNNQSKVHQLLTQNDATAQRVADPNIITPQGVNILSIALRNNIDIAIDLLDHGASLMYLVASNNVHDVEALLATYHANPNEHYDTNVPLLTKAIQVAKETGSRAMMEVLLYYGPEIQPVVYNNNQIIADIETIEILLTAHAHSRTLNRDNQEIFERLLVHAVVSNNEKLIKLLLSYRIPIDRLIVDSKTDPNIIEKLIRLGAQLSEPNTWYQNNTPLQLAVAHNDSGARNRVTEAILQAIMSIDKNLINAKNKSQQTALHIAASIGNVHDTEMLLRAGASDEIYDCQGYLPIHELVISAISDQNRLQVARMLITYGRAGISAKTKNGATVLHYVAQRNASFGNTPEFVEHLVNEGLNVNAQNIHGDTPLIYAVRHGNIEVIQSLLNANADPTIANGFGESAVTIAQRYGHTEIIDLIRYALAGRLARTNAQQIRCHCISTCAL